MQRRRIVMAVVVSLVATTISLVGPVVDAPVADAGIDTDAVVDLVFAQGGGDANQACLGTGSGFDCADLNAGDPPVNPLDVALVDIDHDGDHDLVFAGGGEENAACLNDGTGSFACSDFGGSADNTGVALGDIDRDGDIDAVISRGTSDENLVCDNDGSGSFTCVDVSADTDDSLGVAVGDIDRDGWLDVVFANDSVENQVCLNDGDGTFTCADVSAATDDSTDVALGDFDGDGDLDAYFLVTGGTDQYCTGAGDGSFSGCANADSAGGTAGGLTVADFDRDGDLDVVIAANGGPNRRCANDGTGSFTCGNTPGGGTNSTGVASHDFDRDGDLDIVFSNAGAANRVCIGDGLFGFNCADVSADTDDSAAVVVAPELPNLDVVFGIADADADNVQCRGGGDGVSWQCGVEGMDGDEHNDRAVLIEDFDRDGLADVVIARDSSVFNNQICLNDGDGTFTCSAMGDPPDQSRGAVAGDFDADGDIDVVFANTINRENQICFNDGSGGFGTCSDISADIDTALDVAAGDLDSDGDLDLLFANLGTSFTHCSNDGSGSFTCGAQGSALNHFGVALSDLDADGDLDAVFAILGPSGSPGGEDQVCENDGAGVFTCSDIDASAQNSATIVAADFDNDGDDDLLVGNANGGDRLCENDGAASFTCVAVDLGGALSPFVFAVDDLNRDGLLDVAVADDDASGANQSCLNDGDNTFTCTDIPTGVADARGVAIGDLGNGFCNGLYATIEGTAGEDDLDGTTGADVIQAWAGNDDVFGDEGDDMICLGDGNDVGDGGSGADTVYGEDGDDDLDGGNDTDADTLDGGDGTDRAAFTSATADLTMDLGAQSVTGHGSDTLVSIENALGGSGDDTITGTAGSETLGGGPGDDTIFPVGGADVVDGGGTDDGRDVLDTDWEADGATAGDPVEIEIGVFTAGTLWYEFGASGADPSGYSLFDTTVTITAPAESAADPIELTFTIDSTELGGVAAADVEVFKDGSVLADCSGAAGEADPDPCVFSRAASGDDAAVVVHTSSGSEWAFGEAVETPGVVRYAGSNRFGTSAAIAQGDFPDAGAVDTVFLAVGNNFPDALAGAAIAGKVGAPLLLVNTDSVPTETLDELNRLEPGDVVILGGTAVISDTVKTAVEGLSFSPTVTRLAGANRYATAVAISQHGFPGTASEVVVATGTGFADALAGAPAAVSFDAPVLLTDPFSLPSVIADEIVRLDPDRIVVLGGTAAVSSTVYDQLEVLAPDIVRLSGSNRYETAVAISDEAFTDALRVYLATGLNFPDALAGAAAAAFYGTPVLLVPGSSIPTVVSDEITRLGPVKGIVLGGSAVVTSGVEAALAGLL